MIRLWFRLMGGRFAIWKIWISDFLFMMSFLRMRTNCLVNFFVMNETIFFDIFLKINCFLLAILLVNFKIKFC